MSTYSEDNCLDVSIMDTKFYKQNLHKEVLGKHLNSETKNKIFYKCVISYDRSIHKIGPGEHKISKNCDYEMFRKHKYGIPAKHCECGLRFTNNRCCRNGFYFTDVYNIFDHLRYCSEIATVRIPDDAICYLENNELRSDKLILESVEPLQNKNFIKNVDLCLNVVKKNGMLIKYFNKEMLSKNTNIYVEAVKQYGYLIQYISKEIVKNNMNICLAAVKQNGE
jgi:hypothetical protein